MRAVYRPLQLFSQGVKRTRNRLGRSRNQNIIPTGATQLAEFAHTNSAQPTARTIADNRTADLL
jgi:hypothetical protein